MKIQNKILTLFVLASEAQGFFVPSPKPPTSKLHVSANFGAPAPSGDPNNTGSSNPIPQSPSPALREMAAVVKPPATASTLGAPPPAVATPPDVDAVKNIWDESTPITVQGGSLRTWSFTSPAVTRVQVLLKTEGRPLNADVELWQGPDNTPQKMAIYLEDGDLRPFSGLIETPRGSNTISIRNTAHMEFPLAASVEPDIPSQNKLTGLSRVTRDLFEKTGRILQGGAIVTFPFDPSVSAVSVLLKTDGRPLNARVELLQGPNNNKQVVEVYTEDGLERPFFLVLECPGSGNVVRVVNTATVEFPLTTSVEAFLIDNSIPDFSNSGVPNGGANSFFFSRP